MASEHTKARAWRQRRKLTLKQLADMTGYSVPHICCMEAGLTPKRKSNHTAGKAQTDRERAIKWFVWRRYKLACAGVEAELSGKTFAW